MNKETHNFNIKDVEYEIFFGKDGLVEIYEIKNPGNTGFIFQDIKKFTYFINMITDALEVELTRQEDKNET